MNTNILVIDDEADIRDVLGDILEDEGYSILKAAHSEQALSFIEKEKINLIILDIWLENSDMDGIEILKSLKGKNSKHQDIPVLMISGHGNVEMAVDAMKIGAYDFVEKPFKIDHILLTVERALEQSHLKQENTKLRGDVLNVQTTYETKSTDFQNQLKEIEEQAKTDARMLISGEIGTGKSRLARHIHNHSARQKNPYYEYAAQDLSEQMILDFFSKEDYHLSTLTIDKIDHLAEPAQNCLLKILSSSLSHTAPRLICTASDTIKDAVKSGTFSSALYDRIAVIHQTLPNLMQRSEDIPALVKHFSSNMSHNMNSPEISFGTESLFYLQDYHWTGNIRQLKSTIDWITLNHILNKNIYMPVQFKEVFSVLSAARKDNENAQEQPEEPDIQPTSNLVATNNNWSFFDKPLREAREEFERQYLTVLLKRFSGNISQMAQHVDMERTALHRKLKTLDIRYDDIAQHNQNQKEIG